MGEWKEYKLGDVINLKRGYDLPSQARKTGKIPIYSSSGITDYHVEPMAKGPGVITGRYGTVGQVFFSDGDYWPLNTTLYVQDFKGNDPKYIYYLLKGFDFEKYSDKSAVPGINRNDVHTELILIPHIPEQKSIASILSSLDDKIDLLHRQNKTLEALAEMLFRQWFVEEAEEGWKTGKLGDYASVSTGRGLKRNEFIEDGKYPVLGANGEIGRTNNYLNDERLILTGRVGTLGKVHITEDKVWISDNVLIVKPIKGIFFYPLYYILKRIEFENLNVGSTQPLVTQTDLKNIDCKFPNIEKLTSFAQQASSYFDKISFNNAQICTLTRLRDTLLPKLMSGEVRVKLPLTPSLTKEGE